MFNNLSFNTLIITRLAQVTKLVYKWLPDNLKHDVLFYSTLLTKLIEGADKVIRINKHIEEKAYEVSLRHPNGVEILVGLSGAIVGKGFEALTDAERTQVTNIFCCLFGYDLFLIVLYYVYFCVKRF